MAEKVKLASVDSYPGPQPGQKHRSSGNFSTEDAPSGTTDLFWEITNNSNAGSIKFNVKKDKSAATDPTEFKDVGNATTTKYISERRLYIADPEGAGDSAFVVVVYALVS